MAQKSARCIVRRIAILLAASLAANSAYPASFPGSGAMNATPALTGSDLASETTSRETRSDGWVSALFSSFVSEQPAVAAENQKEVGGTSAISSDSPELSESENGSNQAPPQMVPPEVTPGGGSSSEVEAIKQRILSKLSLAEAKGVGTTAYRNALNGILGGMSVGSVEQNLSLLKGLEQNLDAQSKGTNAPKRDAIGGGIQYGNLTIVAGQPVMNTKVYNKANRPPGVPVPAQFEGFTIWNMNPHVDVHWNDSSQVVAKASVRLSCEIVTWLPSDASKKLVAHESGHAKICLTLYKRGHLVVREMAQRHLMNRPWRGGDANKQFQAAFQAEIKDVINWLNEEYDRITDHGRNSVDSDQAVAEAFRRCSQGYKQYLKK